MDDINENIRGREMRGVKLNEGKEGEGGSEIEGISTIAETVENGRLKGVFVSEM